MLAAAMGAAGDAAGVDPWERIGVTTAACRRFAIDKPRRYRLMFSLEHEPERQPFADTPLGTVLQAWTHAADTYLAAIAPARRSEAETVGIHLWTALHGQLVLMTHPVRSPHQQRSRGFVHRFGIHAGRVEVHKGQTHAITFALDDASRPFLTENEQRWRFCAPELRRRLSGLQATASVAERVQAALCETLPAGGTSMTEVARHLAVSSRTLQRQPKLEGASFPGNPRHDPRRPGPPPPRQQHHAHRRNRLPAHAVHRIARRCSTSRVIR
ncbi:TetR-like C-terminal domain-containing protein [Lentzea sp. NPDC004782]|uniref:TetR-like C-terminal domain-containing protein n=1 Tax=Lentzea sp. NPDC004782 TaxID=3154458 RepID=UPI0033A9FDC5